MDDRHRGERRGGRENERAIQIDKELTMHSESEEARDGEYERTIDNDECGTRRIAIKGEEART